MPPITDLCVTMDAGLPLIETIIQMDRPARPIQLDTFSVSPTQGWPYVMHFSETALFSGPAAIDSARNHRERFLQETYRSKSYGPVLDFAKEDDRLWEFLKRAYEATTEIIGRKVAIELERFRDPEDTDFDRIFLTALVGDEDGEEALNLQSRLVRDFIFKEFGDIASKVAIRVA